MPIQQFDLLQKSAIIDIQTDLENSIAADVLLASKWASNPENVVVADGKYSSLHYMEKANDAKIAAELAETNSETAQGLSEAARDKSQQWAENPEDTEVETGKYSAKHYSLKAAASAAGIADSAEMLIKHEAGIASLENTINSANINQETTATATGVDTVALPKTAANTGMQVQMFGQSAQNLVLNGDFRNGTTGWVGSSGATLSIVDGKLKITTTSAAYGSAAAPSITVYSGNKYYKAVLLSHDSTVGENCNFQLGSAADVSAIQPNTRTVRSVIQTVNTTSNNYLYIGKYNQATVFNIYVENAVLINLTATFGAGNEPTKEQCDLLFANYFEGSDNVLGTGRISSPSGKNLFDKKRVQYNKTIETVSGDIVSSAGLAVTGFIPVKAGLRYQFSGRSSSGFCFYNKLKQTVFSSTGQAYVAPASSEYLVLNLGTNLSEINTLQVEVSSAATAYEPYKESSLYLTTPELRSNGTVKDEIRNGTNGYELVKRVGVGTLGANGIAGGDFEGGLIGSIVVADEVATYTLNTSSPISGTKDARLQVATIGTNQYRPLLAAGASLTTRASGQLRKFSFKFKVNSGTLIFSGFAVGGSNYLIPVTLTGSGIYQRYYVADGSNGLAMYFDGRNLFDVQIDDIKDELIAAAGLAAGTTSSAVTTELGNTVHYTLATPTITPIAHAGLLNSSSNGTAYFEPIIADAGVYSSNLVVQLTDYPISTFETIRKYANGTYTELNTATAVIASGGLSFTHPDLTAGDLVMFTYAYTNESIGRSMTLTYAISNSNPYYNVTNSIPLTTGYYTSTTARAAVPEGIRKTGLILTYETAAGVWYTERYIGTATDTTSWTTAGNWEIGVLRIAAVTDTTEYAEITI